MTKARDLANGGFGLVLVKPSSVVGGTDNGKGTVNFSGVSTVSLNNCFNSTYRNYKVIIDYVPATTSGAFSLRLRSSGSDNSTSNYQRSIIYMGASTPLQTRASQSDWSLLGNLANDYYSLSFDVFTPFASLHTHAIGSTGYRNTSTTANEINNVQLGFSGTNSFDGISLLANGPNITGTVSVFGYNN